MQSIDILIIALLIITILLLIISITKKDNSLSKTINSEIQNNFKDINNLLNDSNHRLYSELNEYKISINKSLYENNSKQTKDLNEFKNLFNNELNNNFRTVNTILENKLLEINKDMNAQITSSFSKTNEAFNNMIERLAKIDEAQKKIENLSTNIISLQDILSDKKSRGAFGEVQLNNILKSIFGQKEEYYKIQHKLSNGMIVDALLKVPDPVGNIAIDSKFPLESYRRMMDNNLEKSLESIAVKQFKLDLKKHIDDISQKYILEPETTNSAILFLPAEAVFAQIHAYHHDIIDYAAKNKVWITSPTTLMATLTSIQVIVQNIEQSKYAKIIQSHLSKLNDDFQRYNVRWDNLAKKIESVSKDTLQIHTSTKKISSHFSSIAKVQFEEKDVDLIADNSSIETK